MVWHFVRHPVYKNEHALWSLISNLNKIRQDIVSSSSTKEQNDMISHMLVKFEQFAKKEKNLTKF